ncbi:MAG: hypothetical protein R3E13_06780 [Alphaproteobacteria bacterium]
MEIKDSRSKEEFDFEYYKSIEGEGEVDTPIRAAFYKGERVAAVIETINPDTGELVQDAGITRYDTDPYVEEITEEEFYALCGQKMQKKNCDQT